jgi:hypothetical protein
MNHSHHSGFNGPSIIMQRFNVFPSRTRLRILGLSIKPRFRLSCAIKVGQNPDTVPAVGSPDGNSWKNKRDCGVPCTFHFSQHHVEAQRDVPSNIFKQAPSGPESLHNTEHVWPEMAVIRRASTLPRIGKRLAWVSTANNVNCRQLINDSAIFYILPSRNYRPMSFQYPCTERINLHLASASHANTFKAKRKAAYASAKIQKSHDVPPLKPPRIR